jgi:hypothetical protein
VIREADELPHAPPRHEHGHDKVLRVHSKAWSRPKHEHVNALGVRLARVRVPAVAVRGKPWVVAGVRVAVRQGVVEDRRENVVWRAVGASAGKGVDIATKQLDVSVRRTDAEIQLTNL